MEWNAAKLMHWVLIIPGLKGRTFCLSHSKWTRQAHYCPVEPVPNSYRLPVDERGDTRCVFSTVVFQLLPKPLLGKTKTSFPPRKAISVMPLKQKSLIAIVFKQKCYC